MKIILSVLNALFDMLTFSAFKEPQVVTFKKVAIAKEHGVITNASTNHLIKNYSHEALIAACKDYSDKAPHSNFIQYWSTARITQLGKDLASSEQTKMVSRLDPTLIIGRYTNPRIIDGILYVDVSLDNIACLRVFGHTAIDTFKVMYFGSVVLTRMNICSTGDVIYDCPLTPLFVQAYTETVYE